MTELRVIRAQGVRGKRARGTSEAGERREARRLLRVRASTLGEFDGDI
jgi:hypothetical protein